MTRCRTPIFVAILSLASLVGACARTNNPEAAKNSLRRGLGGEPATLNPARAVDTFSTQVVYDLYEGLTSISPKGEIIPGVATSWTIDATGREYTFFLRPNALWSNGTHVRAQDFVFAWQQSIEPKSGNANSTDVLTIEGAEEILAGVKPTNTLGATAKSDGTLVVRLAHPLAFFPQLLAHSAMFPAYSASSVKAHTSDGLISNGPFVLREWKPGARIELRKNEMYWNKSQVRINNVVYEILIDQNAQYAAYRSGQLDVTDSIPQSAFLALRQNSPNEVLVTPYRATAYYGVNFKSQTFKNKVGLRKALALVLDRKYIVDSLGLGQLPAYSLVPPGTWNYIPQPFPWSTTNIADRISEARRLYKESGYSPANPLRIRLLINSNQSIKQTAIMIAAMWQETLGIKTEIADEEFRVFLQSRKNTDRWDILRLAWNADYDDATSFLDTFRGNSTNNDFGYENPQYDKLLNAASETIDVNERRKLLQSAEQLMLSEYPIIPLFYFVSKHLVKPYVHGFLPNPFDRTESKYLTIDRP
jgi:oligopeptide transport system substrate-binding protein